MVGKYIPTQDSKTKRLSMRIPKSEPGVEKSDDTLPAKEVNGDRIVDRMGSDVKADTMRGVDVEMESVAHPMASVANPSIPAAKFSVETALLFPFLSTLVEDVIWPNIVDPRRQHAMKHEKTVPYGVPIAAEESVANLAKYALTALLTAGGQLSTKIYMAASNNDWIEPTSIILGSSLTTLTASRIVGFEPASSPPLLTLPATFSFHVNAANNPPKIKNPTDNSNGPLGPRDPAAIPAI